MNYGEIKNCDIANGVGVRVSLFVSGCTHHCKNCFNSETWDFDYGKKFDDDVQDTIIKMLSPEYIAGLTILGGEPFEPSNQEALLPFIKRVKEKLPQKNIWMYSGYTYEELTVSSRARCQHTDEILSLIDVLVDGRFVEEKKKITLKFRGSENQRVIDVPSTLSSGEIVTIF